MDGWIEEDRKRENFHSLHLHELTPQSTQLSLGLILKTASHGNSSTRVPAPCSEGVARKAPLAIQAKSSS